MKPLVTKICAAFRKLLRNRALYTVACVWGFFGLLVWLMVPIDLRRLMDSARFGTAFVAFWVTSSVALVAMWDGVRDRGGLIAISWTLVWGTIAFQSVYIPAVRELPHMLPDWARGQYVPSAIGYSYALSAALFILAVASGRSATDEFGRQSWTFLLTALTAVGVVAGVAIGVMIGMGISGKI